jgi:hypothetical protein
VDGAVVVMVLVGDDAVSVVTAGGDVVVLVAGEPEQADTPNTTSAISALRTI